MNKIQELVKELDVLEIQAGVNPEDFPMESRASHTIVKRQAQDRFDELSMQYKSMLQDNLAVLFLVSDDEEKQAKFLELADKEGASVVVDVNALYKRLANIIDSMFLNDRQYTPNHAHRLMQELVLEGRQVGVFNLTNLNYTPIFLNNLTETTTFVKQTVRNGTGDGVNILAITKQVLNLALQKRLTGRMVPIIMTGITQEELPAFQQAFVVNHLVNLDKNSKVDKKFVVHTLTDLIHNFDLSKK